MRLAELIGLKISDLNLYNNTLIVLGKRNKQRIIPVNQTLVEAIKKYLTLRTDIVDDTSNNFLILTDNIDHAIAVG